MIFSNGRVLVHILHRIHTMEYSMLKNHSRLRESVTDANYINDSIQHSREMIHIPYLIHNLEFSMLQNPFTKAMTLMTAFSTTE
jgi:hypothetical protein